jgi:hypothetical protein
MGSKEKQDCPAFGIPKQNSSFSTIDNYLLSELLYDRFLNKDMVKPLKR